jgi:prepilin-type N-terminal cleavage/methylation domain-containing protein
MKRQSSFWQYGFTLVEIMLVIVLLGVIFYSMASFWSPQWKENSIKVERLANNISDILHTGLINITIWKVENGVTLTGARIRVAIGTWDSLTGIVRYQYGNTPFQSISLFDEDSHYQVERIGWNGWVLVPTGVTERLDITLSQTGNFFLGDINMDNSATEVDIRVRYMDKTKTVTFDRRTGRIEIN